jgi:SAM-dependent methyltransferase
MGLFSEILPAPILRPAKALWRWWQGQPPVGGINLGDLRRLEPISRSFGRDRGLAIDRHYVENFLESCSKDIRGRVLEIGEDTYTRRFGGNRVTKSDVLHVHDRNRQATIVGDLADAPRIPDASFDCIILTQTLQFLFDVPAAMRTLGRILAPGGVVLITVPGISQVAVHGEWGKTWYWAFTELAMERLLREHMRAAEVQLWVHGNVLAATGLLYGLASEDLTSSEKDTVDPEYQVIIAGRAVKGLIPE